MQEKVRKSEVSRADFEYQARKFDLSKVQGISREALDDHLHLYQGYVENTNKLLEEALSARTSAGRPLDPESWAHRLGFEFNGMVLHELTTNAAKHGALSHRGGHVQLRWWWLRNGSSGRLAIKWQEMGGPAVQAPHRTGYGTSVIRELIPFELDGKVDLDFAPDGVRCRVEIPKECISIGSRAMDAEALM